MTTRTITDAESIARQQALLSAMLARAEHYAAVSDTVGAHGHGANAVDFALLANCCRRVADRTRERLLAVSELTLADVQEEDPPATLVALTDWLRSKLGRYFPRMPVELWQGIACVLNVWRGRA